MKHTVERQIFASIFSPSVISFFHSLSFDTRGHTVSCDEKWSAYMSTGGGWGRGGIKATIPLKNFKKGTPLKILLAQPVKILRPFCSKILVKKAKFWGKYQNFKDFFSKFSIFFTQNFGDPCNYHKSVKKNLKFLWPPPLKFFKKWTPTIFGRAHVWWSERERIKMVKKNKNRQKGGGREKKLLVII
jgi:hypothetical protein